MNEINVLDEDPPQEDIEEEERIQQLLREAEQLREKAVQRKTLRLEQQRQRDREVVEERDRKLKLQQEEDLTMKQQWHQQQEQQSGPVDSILIEVEVREGSVLELFVPNSYTPRTAARSFIAEHSLSSEYEEPLVQVLTPIVLIHIYTMLCISSIPYSVSHLYHAVSH